MPPTRRSRTKRIGRYRKSSTKRKGAEDVHVPANVSTVDVNDQIQIIDIPSYSDKLYKDMYNATELQLIHLAIMASRFPDNYVSIDVECVATGHRHDERSVSLVAVVDKNERVLLRKTVKPEKPVVSYLTPLTGLRKGDLDHDGGEQLSDVIREVKSSLLGCDVVLVGQGIESDIKWLELKQGIDFHEAVDLAQLFKGYNARYHNYNYHSLRHEANTLLGSGTISDEHDPVTDAQVSIRLFKKYYNQPALLERAQQQLIQKRPPQSWVKKCGYSFEGVCLAAYFPEKCTCGAPSLK